MSRFRFPASGLMVVFWSASLFAEITSHNGSPNSDPPGDGSVNVLVLDTFPPGGGLAPLLLFMESATWSASYAFEMGEPPVSVDLFLEENLTEDTWYAFRVTLVGGDFVFASGTPVPEDQPVGAGVSMTVPTACSFVARSGGDATLTVFFRGDQGVLPGDGVTVSFFASGSGSELGLDLTPISTLADADGDDVPDACDGDTVPSGACCDVCLGVCADDTAEADCPSGNVWTAMASCVDACSGAPLDCDDGVFCNGVEGCASGACTPGIPSCIAPLMCIEELAACVECLSDMDCDDALFCNGAESCVAGFCLPGLLPCEEPEFCDESGARCVACMAAGDCDDDNECTGDLCVDGDCFYESVEAGASCADDLFCNGEESCDGDGECVEGDLPCSDDETCDESTDECVQASGTIRAYCAELGDNHHSWRRDREAFKFWGRQHETVKIRLEADGDDHTGEYAVLKLRYKGHGYHFVRRDRSALPNEIIATLPRTGHYRVIVRERRPRPNKPPFLGGYCLTLESSENAAATFVPRPSVENPHQP